jgi:hypothetical protein
MASMGFASFFLNRAPALLVALAVGLPAAATPCCGTVSPEGQRLASLLDASNVGQLWQAHVHVLWLTGQPDPARPGYSRGTHCSAYAAAMAQRAGIPLLHPPEHGQRDLANAQFQWLQGPGSTEGWMPESAAAAQSLANQGYFVLAVFENPNPAEPGHIAILRPSEKSPAALAADGPQEAQAGEHNYTSTSIAHGFAEHHGAWMPGGTGSLRFFAHKVDWNRLPAPPLTSTQERE